MSMYGPWQIRYRLDDGDRTDGQPYESIWAVVRKTDMGAWVVPEHSIYRLMRPFCELSREERSYMGARFVLDGNGKRYAHETREWARESYRIRKVRQIQRCEASIDRARTALHWLKEGKAPQPEWYGFDLGDLQC